MITDEIKHSNEDISNSNDNIVSIKHGSNIIIEQSNNYGSFNLKTSSINNIVITKI